MFLILDLSEKDKQNLTFYNSKTKEKKTNIFFDSKNRELLFSVDTFLKENNVDKKDLEKWTYLKGAKKILKKSKSGYEYYYAEGKMAFPDSLDKPARTIITGEGGSSPSRFKHIIKTKSGKFRRLMPVELERINMFPDNHTKEGTDNKRAFLMGNALVVGVIEKIALELAKRM